MKKLFDKQAKLDDIILANLCKRVGKDITHRQLADKRLLATYVELGEFIEEKDHQKKLIEVIDILHFLLSDGLALGVSECVAKHNINTLYAQSVENMYNDAINNFMNKFSKFVNASRVQKYWSVNNEINNLNLEKQYFKTFLAFFDLCKTMEYSVEDIRNGYFAKWKVNIDRQKSNY